MNIIEKAKRMVDIFLGRLHDTTKGSKAEETTDYEPNLEYISIRSDGVVGQTFSGTMLLVGGGDRIQIEVDINIPQEYIDTVALDDILKSVDDFMEASGFEYESKEEPIYGSFFQKLMFFAKSEKTQSEVVDVLEKGKAALQANFLNKPVADATAQLSNAAASLITSCAGVDEIVIRAGILILVKTTINGKVKMMVETISPQLMIHLDENPGMLKDPTLIYYFLEQLPERLKRANGNYSDVLNTESQAAFLNSFSRSRNEQPDSESYALGA